MIWTRSASVNSSDVLLNQLYLTQDWSATQGVGDFNIWDGLGTVLIFDEELFDVASSS